MTGPRGRRPRLGILVGPGGAGVGRVREVAVAAAERGLVVGIAEHAARPDYVASALAAAAVVAGAAPGAEIVTAATVAGLRDPESLVRDATTVAACAALTVGLVAGHDPADLPGDRWARRFTALDAAIDALAGRIPVLVGGAGPKAMARADRAGGWLAPTSLPPDEVAARAAGLPRTVAVRRWVPGDPATAELPPGTRTPRDLLVGPSTVDGTLAVLATVHTVLLGPVTSVADLEALCAR